MSWTCNGTPSNPLYSGLSSPHAPITNPDSAEYCMRCELPKNAVVTVSVKGGKGGTNPSNNGLVKGFLALTALSLLVGTVLIVVQKIKIPGPVPTPTTTSTIVVTPNITGGVPPSQSPSPINTTYLFSKGERLLIADNNNSAKLAGIKAYAARDYETAITKFETALNDDRNDPETLIYLNNARLAHKPSSTIATVVPITNDTFSALERLRGIAQAQNEAVEANVPFQVLIADDGNDPKQAQSIAEKIVSDETVIAVIGHGTTSATLAAAPVYVKNQLVMIAATTTSTDFVKIPKGSDGNQYTFRTISSDQVTGTVLARHFLLVMKKKNATVFYNSQSEYSNSIKTALTTTLESEGGQVVQEVDLSQPGATRQPVDVTADAIILLPDSNTLKAAIDVAKINNNALPLLAGDAIYALETLKRGGSSVDGMVLAVPWHPDADDTNNFAQVGRELWGGEINWRTALNYDAFQTIRTAYSIAKITPDSGISGRVDLAKILGNPNFQATGATGVIKFLPSGDRNMKLLLLKVDPGEKSNTGYDFVPLLDQ